MTAKRAAVLIGMGLVFFFGSMNSPLNLFVYFYLRNHFKNVVRVKKGGQAM